MKDYLLKLKNNQEQEIFSFLRSAKKACKIKLKKIILLMPIKKNYLLHFCQKKFEKITKKKYFKNR